MCRAKTFAPGGPGQVMGPAHGVLPELLLSSDGFPPLDDMLKLSAQPLQYSNGLGVTTSEIPLSMPLAENSGGNMLVFPAFGTWLANDMSFQSFSTTSGNGTSSGNSDEESNTSLITSPMGSPEALPPFFEGDSAPSFPPHMVYQTYPAVMPVNMSTSPPSMPISMTTSPPMSVGMTPSPPTLSGSASHSPPGIPGATHGTPLTTEATTASKAQRSSKKASAKTTTSGKTRERKKTNTKPKPVTGFAPSRYKHKEETACSLEFDNTITGRKRGRDTTMEAVNRCIEEGKPLDEPTIKRIKNTDAARRSRLRKLQQLQILSESLEQEKRRNSELAAENEALRAMNKDYVLKLSYMEEKLESGMDRSNYVGNYVKAS